MSCEHVERDLDTYLDNELDASDRDGRPWSPQRVRGLPPTGRRA
jgi:hypothetical protein